jgi:hypothetical protein
VTFIWILLHSANFTCNFVSTATGCCRHSRRRRRRRRLSCKGGCENRQNRRCYCYHRHACRRQRQQRCVSDRDVGCVAGDDACAQSGIGGDSGFIIIVSIIIIIVIIVVVCTVNVVASIGRRRR